jgi:hypothetical protein
MKILYKEILIKNHYSAGGVSSLLREFTSNTKVNLKVLSKGFL